MALLNGRKVQSSYQAVAMALLHKRHVEYDPVITIVQRLSRFSRTDRSAMHARVLKVSDALRRRAPACLVTVVLKIWLNGWTTSRIFAKVS